MTEVIAIDGSRGEGGGQILRSALSLALVTGKSVRIENIRAGRDKPGLLRQHLTAVQAASQVGDAEVSGNAIGSQTLTFHPSTIRPGSYSFSVGTAGSGTLVLQTILPALMIADAPSEVAIEGGTHNPWAPPYDFLAQAFFPLIARMGLNISSALERHGFYPAGGGRFSVGIQPAREELKGLQLTDRGAILQRSVTAIVANLPRSIAKREIDTAAEKLQWAPDCFHIYQAAGSPGPGNIVMIELHSEHVREVFTGFGRQGVSAENVAREAIDGLRTYQAADVPVGRHLADQLLLPLGIAAWRHGAKSEFLTLPLSRHSLTHIEVLRTFLGIPITAGDEGGRVRVSIG